MSGGTIDATGRKLNRKQRREMLEQMGFPRSSFRRTKVKAQFKRTASPEAEYRRRGINEQILKNRELRRAAKHAAQMTWLEEANEELDETAEAVSTATQGKQPREEAA